ncbi:hypothetical protein RQP46_000550 [Phenoliferia psychrophenolica]
MIAYDGDLTQPHSATSNTSLFQAAFCESGAQLPTGSILNGQKLYDDIANSTNCTNPDPAASLSCLREAPYEQLVAAVDQTPGIFPYQSHRLAWQPRSDGVFLTADAQELVAEGKIAKIPVIIGDCDDEGTLFAASSVNVTSDAEALEYIQTIFLTGSTDAEIAELALHYPQDPVVRSPYQTGLANQLTPQFKRIASFIGDYIFESPRRFFLQALAKLGNDVPGHQLACTTTMTSLRTMRVSPLFARARPSPVAARATLARPSSHDHHTPSSGAEEVYPEEGFNAPVWRYLAVGSLAVALAIRLAPASAPVTEENPSPITTYLAAHMPEAGLWKARAAKHLELAKEAADDKLLFQDAERPKVRRLRYLGTFEQASPNGIPVGSQADLSDLVIKSEKDDFSWKA